MEELLWSPDAREDLLGISDLAVAREVRETAESELVYPVGEPNALQGTVRFPQPAGRRLTYWRRAVRTAQLAHFLEWEDSYDESEAQACDYCLLYRPLSTSECINYRKARNTVIVLRVVHNNELASYYS